MNWKKLRNFFKKQNRRRAKKRKKNLDYLGRASSEWLKGIIYQKEGY